MPSMAVLNPDVEVAGVLDRHGALPCPTACRCGAEPDFVALGGTPPC